MILVTRDGDVRYVLFTSRLAIPITFDWVTTHCGKGKIPNATTNLCFNKISPTGDKPPSRFQWCT